MQSRLLEKINSMDPWKQNYRDIFQQIVPYKSQSLVVVNHLFISEKRDAILDCLRQDKVVFDIVYQAWTQDFFWLRRLLVVQKYLGTYQNCFCDK